MFSVQCCQSQNIDQKFKKRKIMQIFALNLEFTVISLQEIITNWHNRSNVTFLSSKSCNPPPPPYSKPLINHTQMGKVFSLTWQLNILLFCVGLLSLYVHCDKSLGFFRAIARSAARNKSCSTELSEVQNPCYSWLFNIQLNLWQLPAIAGNGPRFYSNIILFII